MASLTSAVRGRAVGARSETMDAVPCLTSTCKFLRLVLMSAASQRGCGQRLYFGNLDPQVLHARGAAHSRLLHSLLLRRR